MKYILLASSVLIVAACNDRVETENKKMELVKETKSILQDSSGNEAAKDSVPKNIQVDSVIHLAISNDNNSVTVKGYLDKKGDLVTCYLPVVKGKRLTAVVTPEKAKANIRFNHIWKPDGKTDGPFSPSLKYDLLQKGIYKLYIGHNRMAGDPVSTDFVLTVKVQ
jgi:hypothetical protein